MSSQMTSQMTFPILNPGRITGNFETDRPLGKLQWSNLTEWFILEMKQQTFDLHKMIVNIQHDDVTIRRSFQREWTKILQKAAFGKNLNDPTFAPKLEKYRKAKFGPKYSHIRLIDLTQILIEHRIELIEWNAKQKSKTRVKSTFDLRIEEYEDKRRRIKRTKMVQYKWPITEVKKFMIEWDALNPKPNRSEYDDERWRIKKSKMVLHWPTEEVTKFMIEWDARNPKPTRSEAAEQVTEPEVVIEQVEVDDWEQLE